MRVLVTGGAGFVGSHVAEYYAGKGCEVVVYDNLSRAKLLKRDDANARFNWEYLSKIENVTLLEKDIQDADDIVQAAEGADAIIHAAAQTAVTTSVTDPAPDFATNALGTFNVLEAARKNDVKAVVYCSTNKVFGENVNKAQVEEGEKRYSFAGEYAGGIPEDFSIDLCEHTPYGCSKLAGDLYMQDYHHLYGIRTGVFRMSCIYGTRQFGVEDQGWVAWFTIAALTGKPITIFGDGKQVRDVLYVSDLVDAYDKFINSDVAHGVYNTGGGADKTMSLLELLDILKQETGSEVSVSYSDWRPSDQKVYVSDITKIGAELGWAPQVAPAEGVRKLVEWVNQNKDAFQ